MTARGPGAPMSALPPAPRWMGHRGRKIVRTGAWSMLARIAGAANLFVTVPFVLAALGPAQFGAWATLASLVVFAGFLDFGLGNGTMNLVAAAHGRGAPAEVGRVLREGRRTLARVAAWLALGMAAMLWIVPWHRLLGMPEAMAGETRLAAAAVLFAIVLGVPLNLAARVQLGLGRGDRAFRWQAAGQALTAIVVIVLARANASLAVLTAATAATPLLAAIANSVQLWRDPAVPIPPPAPGDRQLGEQIRREGLSFFVLQLAAALAFSADLPLISALRGPTDAGSYAIVQRLFSIVPIGLAMLWVPLWPLYRQALATGDHGWVVRTLHRSIGAAMVVALVASSALALGYEPIVSLWVQRPVAAGALLLGGFVLWNVLDAAGTGLAAFLNAASILRFQVIVASVFAVLCVAAKVLGIHYLGTWAIPFAAALTFVAANLLPTLLSGPRLVAEALARKY